jgi:hypothetical protein
MNLIKKFVQDELERVTVKVYTSPKSAGFKGTGFLFTTDGYILTAWHCIQEAVSFESDIFIESESGEKFLGRLEPEKSIEDSDIAVIKIDCDIDNCVPLGRVPKNPRGDEVISVGYPGIDKNQAGIGVFFGTMTRFVDFDIEIDGAIQGQGQSGGLLYHWATHRIVGVVKDIYKEDVLRNAGLVAKVDFLFSKWDELSDINQKSVKAWDERLESERKKHSESGQKAPNKGRQLGNRLKKERMASLKQQWELCDKKRSALEKQKILENRADEILRLENLIAETSAACQKIEDEIDSLGSQIG